MPIVIPENNLCGLLERKHMRHYLCFMCFIFVVIVCVSALAQDDLQLSGVMQGDKPTAIVNDTIVAVGGIIDNYKVIEITSDHVVFEGKSGRFIKYLKEPQVKTVKPVSSRLQAAPEISPNPPPVVKGSKSIDDAQKHLNAAMDYLRQGDDILRGELKFERLYAKAVSFCDDAEREAQIALSELTDEKARNQVKGLIDGIRKSKEKISSARADFNTHIRSLVAAKQLVVGMTAQDVTSSWGPPLSKSNAGSVERWMYQDENGNQKETKFSDGTLVAF